jgi:hypothetical protein
VAAAFVLVRRADLHFDAMHLTIGVHYQRPDIVANVKHHELGMLPGGVVLRRMLVPMRVEVIGRMRVIMGVLFVSVWHESRPWTAGAAGREPRPPQRDRV